MYRCSECGYEFETPQGHREYYTASIAKYVEGCPHCRSLDYEEVKRCVRCGEFWAESKLAEGLCIECEKEIQEKVNSFFRQFNEAELNYIFESGILEGI